MTAQKLQLKIYTESGETIPLETFIPVFHTWIRDGLLPEMVIDVANYAHVPQGPGVVLIGHAYDYFMDEGEGRRGLLHNRKRPAADAGDALPDLFRRAIHAALLLEKEAALSGLKFGSGEWLLRVNDRLQAPHNTKEAFEAWKPEIASFATPLFAGGAVTIEAMGGPRQLLSARLRVSGGPSLATLLDRLGGPPKKTAG